MEVNPRFGSGILDSVAVGMNGPLMCLRVARKEKVEDAKDYPAAIYLHPFEDSLIFGLQLLNLLICQFRSGVRTKASTSFLNAPTSFSELIKPYRHAYFSRNKKALDPMMKLFLQDPMVLIILWFQHFASVLGAAIGLGRSLLDDFFLLRQQRATPKRQTETR
jgi:hypothetical protein